MRILLLPIGFLLVPLLIVWMVIGVCAGWLGDA